MKINALTQKILFISLLTASFGAWGLGKKAAISPSGSGSTSSSSSTSSARSSSSSEGAFDYVDPTHLVPVRALANALAYYALNASIIKNRNFISVIDFTQNSNNKRFYLIDMRSGEVEQFLVAHGKGSDPDHDGKATFFSNAPGSNATSLGFYLTAETYDGDHGYSLRLDGLSSTNSNARARDIVIHGADYVDPSYKPLGRSLGCPALEMGERTRVINAIQDASLVYAYYAN